MLYKIKWHHALLILFLSVLTVMIWFPLFVKERPWSGSHGGAGKDILQGRLARRARNYPRAEVFFRKALVRDKGDAQVWFDLADVLSLQGRFYEAILCYRQVVFRPVAEGITLRSEAKVWQRYSEACKKANDLDEAQMAARKATQLLRLKFAVSGGASSHSRSLLAHENDVRTRRERKRGQAKAARQGPSM